METSTNHLATWRGRLEALDAQTKLELDYRLAWRFRSEAKISRFLLSRYGDEQRLAPPSTSPRLWMSRLPLANLPGKTRFMARDHLETLRRIALVNAETRNRSQRLGNFFQNMAPAGPFWLEQERKTIERHAKKREREWALQGETRARRPSKRP